jgi:hypothetical protein
MKRMIFIGALCVSAFSAYAQSAPAGTALKSPPIDFSLDVKDPRGKPFPMPCDKDVKVPCENWTLAYAAYLALNTPSQRGQGAPANPEDAKNAALGWRIYSSTAPLDLTTDEKTELKSALFKGLAPAVAYASCRMIVPEEECAK